MFYVIIGSEYCEVGLDLIMGSSRAFVAFGISFRWSNYTKLFSKFCRSIKRQRLARLGIILRNLTGQT